MILLKTVQRLHRPKNVNTLFTPYRVVTTLVISLFLSACGATMPQRASPIQAQASKNAAAPAPTTGPSTTIKNATPAPRFLAAGEPIPVLAAEASPGLVPTQDPAKDLIASGRYLDAALLLSDMAYALPAPIRQDYLLRVTSLLLQGNYIQQADQILTSINISNLPIDYYAKKSVLNAELNLAKQNPLAAAKNLDQLLNNISSASAENQIEYFRARIDVDVALSDYISSAQARTALDGLLANEDEKIENQETLLRDLQNIAPQELERVARRTTDPLMQGWISLATVALNARDEQDARDKVSAWRAEYALHPVHNSILNTIITAQPEALGRPTHIALILPMSGKFAKAATAIRDGFLAAYYGERQDHFKPKISFYDEGNGSQIEQIYQRALTDGADFVVGPLSKNAVTRLANSNEISQGVLTLNYGDAAQISRIPNNFFQMSLSPEQEAVHVAEHAWLDGHTNAAAIYPKTSWGNRVFAAFRDRWEELGGIVVENQTYDTRKSDYKIPIKQLLNLDESEQRFSSVRRLLKKKLQFEPRRRRDVDFIFMAAFAKQGRLLRPQLKFHRATEIPVYATSHVYSGRLKPQMDSDMNGVRFSDMPWTLKNNSRNNRIKKQITKLWPSRSRFMRLYALGVDAYQILPEINRMRRNRFATYQGETGVLYFDVANRLQRKLLWAQFNRGRPKILAEF